MGRLFGLFFSGIWGKAFWARQWKTFLDICVSPSRFFKSLGKQERDDDAFLLGMTATFIVTIPAGFLLWGFISMISGLAGLVMFPLVILGAFAAWILGLLAVYYFFSWLYALAIGWVMGKKPDLNRVRPIVFVCAMGTPMGVVPGLGALISAAIALVLLVIAYENVFAATRGQAVGMGLLGMAMNAVCMFLLSMGVGIAISAATFGAGTAFAAMHSLPFFGQSSPTMGAETQANLDAQNRYLAEQAKKFESLMTPVVSQATEHPAVPPAATPGAAPAQGSEAQQPRRETTGAASAPPARREVQAAPAPVEESNPAPEPTPIPQENVTHQVVKKAAGEALKKGLGKAFGF